MHIVDALIETPVTRSGTLIGEALRICVDCGVPGVPFVDPSGKIAGRFSVRHTFLFAGIPSDMVRHAHLIGQGALHSYHPLGDYAQLFRQPIDAHILPDVASLSSDSQSIKAMALMERFNSAYLFIIDDGHYRGVVTRLSLTRTLLQEFA